MNSNNNFDVASLHKLRPEIVNSLKTLEYSLGEFIDDTSTTYVLAESIETLYQIKSVLDLINLNGSQEIIDTLIESINHLVKTEDNTQKELIYSISEAVMTLNRYIEVVLLRESIHPQLLLTAINNIRRSLKQPLLGESAFENQNQLLGVIGNSFAPIANMSKSTTLLQKTFRHGLSAVINNKDTKPNNETLTKIKLMEIACKHAYNKVGGSFWEIAYTAVKNIESALPLSASRQRALIFLETQFQNSNNTVDSERFADLVMMAASRNNDLGIAVKQKLNLKTLDDDAFSELHRFMFGPNRDVVDTVNELIQAEIVATKEMVNSEAQKSMPDPDVCKKIAISLRDLSLRLYVLGLKPSAERVMKQAKIVSGWTQNNPEQFAGLLGALLNAENETILMAKKHTPGLVSLPLNNTHISLHILDTAFDELVAESRNTLANAVNSISAYATSEDKDILHIKNLPTMLSAVGGAMLFVDVTKGHKLLEHASKYVTQKIKAHSHFTDEQLAKIADILMAADYYLESIEQKQPSGDNPLIIGARSLKSLIANAA